MTPVVQQNPVRYTVQNSTENLSDVQKIAKYRFPGKLLGIVREEDWLNMDSKQQVALILSFGDNPQLYLESNIANRTEPNENTTNIQNNLQLAQERIKVDERVVELPDLQINKPPVAEVSVNNVLPTIEDTKNEFIDAKKAVSAIEQDFISGRSIEGSQNNVPKNELNKQLSQEDKSRIIEETGLNLWMPKFFGYKPSATTIKKATTKKSDDPADYQISSAESWVRLLIVKLFTRNMSANEI